MSKFNKTSTDTTRTVNHAGGLAFTLDDKTALYVSASTSLGGGQGDKYYKTASQDYKNIVDLVNKVAKSDPAFVFQLAAYCREQLYLRSIPVILFVEGIRAMAANKRKGAEYPVNAAYFARKVFGRPDEITEAIAYWLHVNQGNHKLPMPLKKALDIALNSASEYSLTKYDQDDKQVKMRDVLRLVHPKPRSKAQGALFNYIIRDVVDIDLLPLTAARNELTKLSKFDARAKELITASKATWETVISKFGASKETWSYVLPNMGYMAVLRNLNNFMKHDVPVDAVIAKLTDPEQVAKSKQLPFRFYSAMKAIGQEESAYSRSTSYFYSARNEDIAFANWKAGASSKDAKARYKEALGRALELSVANLPQFPGRTLGVADVSGSMSMHTLNNDSTTYPLEIACLFTAMANKLSEDGVSAAFGDTFATIKPKSNILETANAIKNMVREVGQSTNAWTILDYLIKNRIVVDRIMYFTDTECYNSYNGKHLQGLWEQYKLWLKGMGKTAYLYEVNLMGGNTSNFNRHSNVAIIGGWSEKIFDMMATFESDPRKTVTKIAEMYPYATAKELITA